MRQQPRAVMLFAAGFGTRMRPLTEDRPKPLIPVAGRPLIDHALDLVQAVHPDRIVANLHYLPAQLEAHLHPRGVDTLREEPDILDTGGGLRNALPLLGGGAVFTLNTDAIWVGPNPLELLRDAWRPENMDALLCLVPLAQTVGHAGSGDFAMDGAGRLSRGAGYVYGGAQIIKTDRLEKITDTAFSLNRLWNDMAADGRLSGYAYAGKWCDVGHPGGISQAEALLEAPDA